MLVGIVSSEGLDASLNVYARPIFGAAVLEADDAGDGSTRDLMLRYTPFSILVFHLWVDSGSVCLYHGFREQFGMLDGITEFGVREEVIEVISCGYISRVLCFGAGRGTLLWRQGRCIE